MASLLTPVLAYEPQHQLQPELAPDEKVIWAGQPLSSLYWLQSAICVFVGLGWTAMGIVFIRGTYQDMSEARGVHLAQVLMFGAALFFSVVGVLLLLQPFWFRRRTMTTVYAITNQRALVCEGPSLGRNMATQSFTPDRLTAISCIERRNGVGDLVFEVYTTGSGDDAMTVRKGFLAIENVREVEKLLIDTLLQSPNREPV